jgi:hypothetical protein
MTQSITNYVQVTVTEEGTGPQPAGFGTPMFVHEHALETARLAGPFTSASAVADAGHATTSAPYLWAQSVFAQSPRVTEVYIGRADSGDANLTASLDAILAADPAAWYAFAIEDRTADEIKEAAAWCESASAPKIFIAQSNDPSIVSGEGPEYTITFGGTPTDGDYETIFTGFGLSSPVTVTTTRATTPATNADLATQHAADITTLIATTLAGVVAEATATDEDVFVVLENDLATGTVTHNTTGGGGETLTNVISDEDLASDLFNLNYTRTALIYDPDDAVYLDGAWMSRCLSADLDQKKNIWAFKRLNGVSGTNLTDAQVTAIRNTNTNYFSPAQMSSGVTVTAFTAQGWTPSGDAAAGRRIDKTITLDWLKARLEEALADVILRETHGIPYTDAGFNRFATAAERVLSLGIAAGHLIDFVVPEGEDFEGEKTPLLVVPKLSDTTTAQRTSRTFTFSGLAYLAEYIEKVEFSIEVRS